MFWRARRAEDSELDALALRLQAMPRMAVSPEVVRRARARVLAATSAVPMRRPLVPRLVLVGAVASMLALGSVVAVLAAPSSLPGEPLYGLKRAEEQLQLLLTRNPTEAETIRLRHAATRAQESQALEARQRSSGAHRSGSPGQPVASPPGEPAPSSNHRP